MQSLAIDSLLSAARYLESAANSQTSSIFLDPSIPQDTELRDLISGKMLLKRPSSASSTSSDPYYIHRKSSSSKHSRTAHNELEKNRRANLRECLETLKNLVPDLTESARNTTLALLTKARDHIEQVEELDEMAATELRELESEQAALEEELSQLQGTSEDFPEEEIAPEEPYPCSEHASVASPELSPEPQPESRPESVASCSFSASTYTSRDSPYLIEYSPSNKPSPSPSPVIIDPVAEGLVPALPLCYPSRTLYPYFDLSPNSILQDIPLPIRHLIS